jgi:glycosyltransferase involved in cell wall biosynthesis
MLKHKPIIVLDMPGHPFQYELAKNLSLSQESKIIHIHNPKQLGPKSQFENSKNFQVETVSKTISRNHFVRVWDEIVFACLLISKISKLKPQSVLSSNNPIISQFFLWIYCWIFNIKFVYWLQDIYGIAIKKILTKQKNILAIPVSSIFHFIEFFILKRSNHIVTISPDFDQVLLNEKVDKSKITCIPNWAPLNDIPVVDKKNAFTEEHNIYNSFNILYSGTLGFKHNPDVLINLAEYIISNDLEIKMVIASQGPTIDYVKKESAKRGCDSAILFLPFQDFDIFPQVLASADISLVMLEDEAGEFCVPSKLLSILCSKRIPIVYVPKNNLSAKIVTDNKCGFNVSSEKELFNQITEIYLNKSKYNYIQENARKYAEENFRIDEITEKFNKILSSK